MQEHTKNYLKARGLTTADFIRCEYCGKQANDIHHIVFRSHGGTDDYSNLIALDRDCHRMAHSSKEFNERLKVIASLRNGN